MREKTIDTALLQNPFIEFKDHQAAIYEIVRLLTPDCRLIFLVEASQEEQLRRTLSSAGFAYYRIGHWWIGRRIEGQSEALTEQAL